MFQNLSIMKTLQLSDLDLNGTYTYAEYALYQFDSHYS